MGGAIYPRIIGRENQNHQPILHNLYGVPKFLVVFDGGGAIYPRIIGRRCQKFYCDEGCQFS